MTTLNVTDVTRIATQAAREQSANLQVLGVILGGGDGTYAEVLIDVGGCSREPCRLSVGVFRSASEAALHDLLAEKIKEHLRQHAS